VGIRGVSKVRVSAAIAAGAGVGSTADGRGVTGGSLGIALTSATVADELISVLLLLAT
jgi:hypothetical protein